MTLLQLLSRGLVWKISRKVVWPIRCKIFKAILILFWRPNKRILEILIKTNWNSNFTEIPFKNCGLPLKRYSPFPFRNEKQEFHYHLLNSSVSSLINGKRIVDVRKTLTAIQRSSQAVLSNKSYATLLWRFSH